MHDCAPHLLIYHMQGGKVVVLVVWGFFDKHIECLLSARLHWVLSLSPQHQPRPHED